MITIEHNKTERNALWGAFIYRTPVQFKTPSGMYQGYILSIEAEDGSGFNFNVTVSGHEPFYIRMVDGSTTVRDRYTEAKQDRDEAFEHLMQLIAENANQRLQDRAKREYDEAAKLVRIYRTVLKG